MLEEFLVERTLIAFLSASEQSWAFKRPCTYMYNSMLGRETTMNVTLQKLVPDYFASQKLGTSSLLTVFGLENDLDLKYNNAQIFLVSRDD